MTGQPSHIEIGVPDTDRAQRFYGAFLGWKFESTPNGARVDTGGIPAGLHRDERGPELIVFYSVDDLDEAARRIVELGGEVDEAGEEDESGRWLYSCRDDQGVGFGLHQPPSTEGT
jgi:predicted enzyme related to lactoylglutathione lyase